MLATDENGHPAGRMDYSAFGEVLDAGGRPGGTPPADFPRYQYCGAWGYEAGSPIAGSEFDDTWMLSLRGADASLPPVVLYHVGQRWYDPSVGRFVQRDPIGLAGGKNAFA